MWMFYKFYSMLFVSMYTKSSNKLVTAGMDYNIFLQQFIEKIFLPHKLRFSGYNCELSLSQNSP